MLKTNCSFLAAVLAATFAVLVAGGAQAQSKGKIVCWKDKAGKVVGCGDTVPPEYRDNATKELDKRGVTRRTTETAEERARREAQEKSQSAQVAEEKRRRAEQSRQDDALINTFSHEKEIDLKRDRDLQAVDGQLSQLRASYKNAAAHYAEVKGRMTATTKDGKPATGAQKEDLARADADRAKAEQNIAAKEKERVEIVKRYGDMKARYITLRGGPTPDPAPSTAAKKK